MESSRQVQLSSRALHELLLEARDEHQPSTRNYVCWQIMRFPYFGESHCEISGGWLVSCLRWNGVSHFCQPIYKDAYLCESIGLWQPHGKVHS